MSAPTRRQWLGITLSAVVLGLVGGGIWILKNWPFTESAVTRSLERGSGHRVVIGSFHETWFPPGCVATDIKEDPRLLSARSLIIRGSWTGLLKHHLSKIQLVGLQVEIAPAGESPFPPKSNSKSQVSGIEEVEANDAIVEFLPNAPGDQVTRIQIHQLVLDHVGPNGIVEFHGSLKTGKPSGEFVAAGKLGPWNKANTGATPIWGMYRYADADLQAFHGLRGLLSAQGDFNGNLSEVGVSGRFNVPGFHVDGSAHNIMMAGDFRASVNSRTAGTVLERVQGQVGRTVILASGDVTGGTGQEGKTAHIQLTVNSGRVEDLLNYFSNEKHPSLTGPVRLRAYVEVPPGPGFLKKIRLDGDFGVAGGKLTNPVRQAGVDHLSESAHGENKKEQAEDPRTVLSNLKGHVAMRKGNATLSNLTFEFPGGASAMTGSFNMLSKTCDIHGTLRTDGNLSDAASGFKAAMLKIATPFFKKQRTTVVPFTITGPASHPQTSLDLRHKFKL